MCTDRVRGDLVYVLDGSARVPVPSKPFRGASCLRGSTAIRCLLLSGEKRGWKGGWRREAKGEAFFNAPPFEHGGGIYSLITLAAHVRPGIVANDVVQAFCSTAF